MSSPSYDWGLPHPGSQPTPSATTKKRRRILPPLIVVLIVALVAVGAFVALNTFARPSSTGPLGWDEETVSHYFDYDELADCDLGGEFFTSVGLKEMAPENGDDSSPCEGWTAAPDGQPSLNVSFSTAASEGVDDSATPVDTPGLEEWGEIQREATIGSLYSGNSATCSLSTDEPGLENVALRTVGPCESLYPLAQQLTNLARQNEFILDDPGFFDREERPEYVEVATLEYDVYGDDWQEATEDSLALGESVTINERTFVGSQFAVNEIILPESTDDTAEACVDTTYTLGTNSSNWSNRFNLPDLVLYLPDGSHSELSSPRGRLTLQEGESADVTYCGELPPGMRDAEVLVQAQLAGDDDLWASEKSTSAAEEV